MSSQKISRISIHPFLFGVFFVISLYFSNIRELLIFDIVLPLCITIGVIGALWLSFKFFLKSSPNSMLVLSLFVIVFFSYGHVYFAADGLSLGGVDIDRHRYLLLPFLAILVFGTVLLLRSKNKRENTIVITNTISFALVILVVINIGIFNLENNSELHPQNYPDTDSKIPDTKLPNIYYIIFDAYPGYHSLNISDYSNDDIYDFFNDNGFFSSKNSFSNYRFTHLSIPSTLNIDYLHSMANIKNNDYDKRNFNLLGTENKVMDFLKSKGYQIISFGSEYAMTKDMKYADLQLCVNSGSEFFIMLARTSMLSPVSMTYWNSVRVDQRLCVFNELPHAGKQVQEPYFVFAHVVMPHAPYLFGPNGEIRSDSHSKDKSAFLDQVTFANKNIKDIVNQLLSHQNPPVIIIQSDHGSAFLAGWHNQNRSNWNNPNDEMLLERLNNINFIFLPSGNSEIIIADHSPVNTFRIIFNHYFGTDFEILEDKSYIFNGNEFEDVTPRLQNMFLN